MQSGHPSENESLPATLQKLTDELDEANAAIERLEIENRQLKEQLQESGLMLAQVVEHGTVIENDLDERFRTARLQASTDTLTGIFNRLKFEESLRGQLDRRKTGNGELCIIMFDIDHFKQVNDTFGHPTGDTTIVAIVELVAEALRKGDLLARWGGEEFVVLVGNTDLEGTGQLAERLRAGIEAFSFAKVGRVTCSFGVTSFRDADDSDTFLQRVDRALYKAKDSGRNAVVVL